MSFKSKYSGRDVEETIEKVIDLPNDLKLIIDSLYIYVPSQSIDLYKQAPYWSDFANKMIRYSFS